MTDYEASKNLRHVFRGLLRASGVTQPMMVVADALEDIGTEGALRLSRAFRWAADNRKWIARGNETWKGKAYWTFEWNISAPLMYRLPMTVFDKMKEIEIQKNPERYKNRYGEEVAVPWLTFDNVNRAFKCLALALEKLDADEG